MIEYVHQMNRNYVKITKEDNCEIDYGIKMVENNKIEGLLPVTVTDINNRFSCLYDISGQISLIEKYMTKEFSGEDIAYIIGFIAEMIKRMENYMLDPDMIIFHPEYVFCDVSTGEWSLIYSCGEKKLVRNGLRQLFEFILERLDHKDQNAVITGYGMYKRVCREEIPIDRIFDKTEELVKQSVRSDTNAEYVLEEKVNEKVMPMVVSQEQEFGEVHRSIIGIWLDKKLYLTGAIAGGIGLLLSIFVLLIPAFSGQSGQGKAGRIMIAVIIMILFLCLSAFGAYMYFIDKRKETIVTQNIEVPCVINNPVVSVTEEKSTMEECKTMLLSQTKRTKLRLISNLRGEEKDYDITDTPVGLGSGNQADILLQYEGISRVHARISREGDMLFLKDMNSTNGTWVNDRQLSIYELCPIKDGDVIRLAATSFEVIDTGL